MVTFVDEVRVTEYKLTAEEVRFKKDAVLKMRYAMQIRKNKRREELLKLKAAARAAVKNAAPKQQQRRRRSMLPPNWAHRQALRRKLSDWSSSGAMPVQTC